MKIKNAGVIWRLFTVSCLRDVTDAARNALSHAIGTNDAPGIIVTGPRHAEKQPMFRRFSSRVSRTRCPDVRQKYVRMKHAWFGDCVSQYPLTMTARCRARKVRR